MLKIMKRKDKNKQTIREDRKIRGGRWDGRKVVKLYKSLRTKSGRGENDRLLGITVGKRGNS